MNVLFKAALVSIFLFSTSVLRAQEPTPSPTPKPSPECPNPVYIGSSAPDQKLKILDKPEPGFSEDEVQKHPNSVIVLQALFCGSTEKVTNIRIRQGVSAGLNEKAIEAAKKIKFKPGEKNGLKVSQWLILEYQIRLLRIIP